VSGATVCPLSALLQEGVGCLQGTSCGVEVSPPPSGADLQPWWPGIGRRGHLRPNPACPLAEGHYAARVIALGSTMHGARRQCWLRQWGVGLLLRAAAPSAREVM
jgi:hypothetical protein